MWWCREPLMRVCEDRLLVLPLLLSVSAHITSCLSEGSQGVVCRDEGSLINPLSLFIIAMKWKQSKCPSLDSHDGCYHEQ